MTARADTFKQGRHAGLPLLDYLYTCILVYYSRADTLVCPYTGRGKMGVGRSIFRNIAELPAIVKWYALGEGVVDGGGCLELQIVF